MVGNQTNGFLVANLNGRAPKISQATHLAHSSIFNCFKNKKKKSKIFNKILKRMSGLLRGSRSYVDEQKRKDRDTERKRQLVLDALVKQQQEQTDDKLLLDVLSAIPRTNPQKIEEVLNDLKAKDDQAAAQLEDALDHCNELKRNLDGMKPELLWTDPVRMLWTECIQSLTAQSARWKCTPVVLIHPFCGTITVMNSLCGKYQAKSEYARMQTFMDSLKDGLTEVLDSMPVIRDEKSGLSLSRDEVKDILLDLSNAGSIGEFEIDGEGRLSEDCSEDDDQYDDLNEEVKRVSEDWSSDKIEDLNTGESRRTPTTKPLAPPRSARSEKPTERSPRIVLTSTPPRSMNQSISSSMSSFSSPLKGAEVPFDEIVTSTQKTPLMKLTVNKPVNRTLFGSSERRVSLLPPPAMTPTESPIRRIASPPPMASPKQASDLSAAYPDGYTVVPVRNNKNRKSDARKPKDNKKRAVSSPNYPSSKSTRLDYTEGAIMQLQMGQANQNEVLANLTRQMGTIAFNLGLHMDKKTNG